MNLLLSKKNHRKLFACTTGIGSRCSLFIINRLKAQQEQRKFLQIPNFRNVFCSANEMINICLSWIGRERERRWRRKMTVEIDFHSHSLIIFKVPMLLPWVSVNLHIFALNPSIHSSEIIPFIISLLLLNVHPHSKNMMEFSFSFSKG